jgi:hypothetical protein
MAGLNTTGNSAPKDYTLGRGKVYFASLDDTTKLPDDGGYRFLGNAPDFGITVEVETLEHQSSRSGLKVTDKEVTISQKVSLSLSLDELNFQNLATFFSGTTSTFTHGITFASRKQIAADLVQGRWYDIVDDGGLRVYHIPTDATVVVSNAVASGEGTEGTDYTIDYAMGRVFIIVQSVTGIFPNDEELFVSVQNDGTGRVASSEEVRALSQSSVSGALKFISSNPGDNDHFTEYQFHQVALKADGDFSLISDETTTMQLTGVAEANETAGGTTSPTLTVRTHTAAFTA